MTVPARNAVLCGIARDEDRYVVDWIAHHLALGFAHVHLYDNMSARPVQDLLSDWALRHCVTVVRWPTVAHQNAQLTAYDHFLQTQRASARWGAILDLDEFLNLKQDPSVDRFLARFPRANAVAVNWRIFGSSGRSSYEPAPVTERFRHASTIDFDPNKLIKTIYALAAVSGAHQHNGHYAEEPWIVRADGERVDNGVHVAPSESCFQVAQINHYFTKSKDEWQAKNRRGYTDRTRRPPEMFDQYDRNEVLDESILRFAKRVRAVRRKIRRSRGLFGL